MFFMFKILERVCGSRSGKGGDVLVFMRLPVVVNIEAAKVECS